MSKSTITITPIDNIKEFAVINNELVTKETYDSNMDVLLMENNKGERRRSNLMHVSVYNDLIIKAGIKYRISEL